MANHNRRRDQVKTQHGQVAEHSLTINTLELPSPEQKFYANHVSSSMASDLLSLVFAQTVPGHADRIQSAVGIDIPPRALPSFVTSLDIIQTRLAEVQKGAANVLPARDVGNSIIYPGHVFRVTLNDFSSVLDVFSVEPSPTGIEIVPQIRIIAPLAIMATALEICASATRTSRVEG